MKKRLLSLALCLALCLGLFPFGALATDGSRVYEGTGDPEAASVISVNGTTTNYATLPAALNAARDGDTVKLLENHTTNWSNVEAGEEQMAVVKTRITLDLNGNTVDYLVVGEVVPDEEGRILESTDGNLTVQSSQSGGTAMDGQITTLKFVRGTLAVQDGVIIGSSLSSPSGLICEADSGTVTISGGMVYNATVGKGAAVTVSGGSMHQGEWVNNGTLNITGGTFGSVEFYNNSGTIAISGGTFSTLQNLDNKSFQIAPMSLLAPGHAFYKDNAVQDGSRRDFLQNVTVKEHTHTMVINKCACGYTCPHTSVDANGACTVCHKQIAASVTAGEDVTYYDGLGKALNYANQNKGCTLKLLANVESAVSVEAPLIFDLNGHNVQRLSVCAKATIRDSGTEKGKIGKVLIFDKEGETPNLTLGDLLEEGYGFKHENGIWADDSHKETISGLKVTVEEAPIKSVVLDAIGADKEEVPTTMAYGTTGAVTLEASCCINDMTVPTYTWYKLEGAAATAPMEGVNGVKYKLPADLPAGKHTYLVTCTSGGYSKSAEITITVNKAAPTGTPKYTAITTSGKKLSDADLTTAGSTFSVPGHVQWVEEKEGQLVEMDVDTEVKANTAYTWKFMPDDKENYNSLTGTITLWHKSSSGSSSGSVTPGTKTDTVKNPDGSTTKTETKADGSKTETTTASSGGGSTGTTVTKTDAKGNTTTEASAKLSDRDVKEAQEKGEAVTVPVKGIAAAKDANAATKIKIDVPNNANKTTVEIPVENVTSGTVAVIVHEDGTEELVKDSKPTEHGVQLELSGSTTVKIIDNSKDFIDTRDHWSRDEVNFVAARELFNGVGGNQFGVSQPMTRGMVNTVLARLAGVDTTPSQGQAWYEVGTDWAKKNGISDGTNPTAPVTREQLATLLYRYAGSPSVSGTLHAADAASVSDYAEDALLWANQNGIVNGVGSNTIAPKDNAQRAQVAAMLARYLQNQ